jgi:hypothetical protein
MFPMKPPTAAGRIVPVRTYARFRFGKPEVVTRHFRSLPRY